MESESKQFYAYGSVLFFGEGVEACGSSITTADIISFCGDRLQDFWSVSKWITFQFFSVVFHSATFFVKISDLHCGGNGAPSTCMTAACAQ